MPVCVVLCECISCRAAMASPTDWVVSTTEIFFFGILEAGSLRSRCWQGWFLLWPLSLAC